ncbi:cytochrome P450 [Stachybotrys elegans]|uniref:Cytochrome P450 n=1 Tax=Stachybotrys elegans TaxID=80388 RepID=A0A8K0T1X0_9HYPO|nr:cytochrome P450 [Stachybotrys elegans]
MGFLHQVILEQWQVSRISLLGWLGLLAGCCCAAAVVYALCFDPLRDFPGPVSAKFSRLPYWFMVFRGLEVKWMQRLHQKYGPVVRFAPTELSFCDGHAWREIYLREKGREENIKDTRISPLYSGSVPPIGLTSDEDHARVRRLLAPAFSERALKLQEPLFQHYADTMLAKIAESAAVNEGVDMVKMFNYTTFDIMAQLVFGENLGLLDKQEYTGWVKSFIEMLPLFPLLQFINHYPWLKRALERVKPKSVEKRERSFFEYSVQAVDRRMKANPEQPDVWSLVLEGLSIEEMHANAMFFMIAGSETTATLLSGLTYLLLQNPDKLLRLTSEVRRAFDTREDITIERLATLDYLNACISEALRCYPPLPIGLPRLTPAGGNTVMGRYIPGNVAISVHHGATYTSEINFKDPHKFVPERWLGDPEYSTDNHYALQPFILGPRNCLGQAMAHFEMRLLFAKFIYSFDFELATPCEDWMDQRAFVVWQKKPLICKTTLRS